MDGTSALFKRSLKWRPRRLVPLVVVPVRVRKMRFCRARAGPPRTFLCSGEACGASGFCVLVRALYGAAFLGFLEDVAWSGLGCPLRAASRWSRSGLFRTILVRGVRPL